MKKTLRKYLQPIYRRYLEPRSAAEDDRRREFILNILLAGILGMATAALLTSVMHHLFGNVQNNSKSLIILPVFWLLISGLLWLSRSGKRVAASYIVVSLVAVVATIHMLQWSFELPIVILVYTLAVILAGVLIGDKPALIIMGIITIVFLGSAYAQTHGMHAPNVSWLGQPPEFGDAIGNVAILWVVGLVSWLANREINRSLSRARESERLLQYERDNLEVKVAERTRELEEAQALRLAEVQKFAEFGRVSAGLLHEVSNPLTAASLDLEQLKNKDQPRLVRQIQMSLEQLRRYVETARRQLVSQSKKEEFTVLKEINKVQNLLRHRLRKERVSVAITCDPDIRLYGDVAKFNQILSNLLNNAIDAYADINAKTKPINIRVHQTGSKVFMSIHDQGVGIPKSQQAKVFEPFYSTKRADAQNLGIGMSLVKKYIEQDFGGTITVHSTKANGTVFTARLPKRGQRES